MTLLVDSAVEVSELEEEAILKAKAEAERLLNEYKSKEHTSSDIDIASIESSLARSVAQMHVLRKRKK
jgi:F0F1-type ATP synthase epsilon subunit